MGNDSITILDIVNLQDQIRRQYYVESGLREQSAILEGLAGGLDSTLTIMEVSIGPFKGMSKEAASEIIDYFLQESYSHKNSNLEVSIWYLSWAKTLETLFVR
jgi:hypothetical protein